MDRRLTIVGIGYKPLSERARTAMKSARAVLGSRRLVEVFASYPEYAEAQGRMKQIDSVDETMRFIRESFETGMEEIVLLGSGDPLFFGIGRRAVQEFGQDTVEIIPDLTSLQAAFSRIKEPWDDAIFISLHAGPNPLKRRRLRYDLKDLPLLLETHDTIGVLTDKENSPAVIAGLVASRPFPPGSIVMYVGEKMGYPDERITTGSPEKISTLTFDPTNVVIIRRLQAPEPVEPHPSLPRFGLKETEIAHDRGLITKDEVRAVTIHALRLPDKGVLWDIGAGSGALSVEAARLYPGLAVFSIERNEDQLRHIDHNRSAFEARNITVVRGEAPGILQTLPAPDRAFVGGSGGSLEGIVDAVGGSMKQGIVVINAATLETLGQAVQELEKAGFRVDVAEVSVSRSQPLAGRRLMTALNPIFVVKGEKR
jgi:precorrin-6Y C5,15-methyltransferase (decarboxylating)